jgi:hypothetical protein
MSKVNSQFVSANPPVVPIAAAPPSLWLWQPSKVLSAIDVDPTPALLIAPPWPTELFEKNREPDICIKPVTSSTAIAPALVVA